MSGKPPHHTPEGFRNPVGGAYARYTISGADRWAFLWRRMVFPGRTPTIPDGHIVTEAEALAGFEAMHGRPALTWLGHAAFLIQLGGKTIITDPWLTQNASPLGGIGVSRLVPPGISIEKLPPIDALIVSHNHYDHLDAATVEALPNKDRITVLAPLRLGEFFRARGYADVRELDWHDRVSLGAVTITSLPAVHFSRRGLGDSNQTLWMGAMIEGAGKKIYFSGDTAHGPVFAKMGERYGPFDLAMVPIGAYEPLAMMRAVHTTPEDAVELGLDLRARVLLGHHWGTVILTDEPPFEPPGRFRAAGRAAGIEDDRLWLLRVGETRALTNQ